MRPQQECSKGVLSWCRREKSSISGASPSPYKDDILIFLKSNISLFTLMVSICYVMPKKALPIPWLQKFSSRSFMVLAFTFKFVIHL